MSAMKVIGRFLPLSTGNRFRLAPREAAAYVILRRQGISVNQIAKAFGRSRSVVHRILKRNVGYGVLRQNDLRKLPSYVRKLSAIRTWNMMLRLLGRWEAWIFGEGEKPP
jgi:hypothetical protein